MNTPQQDGKYYIIARVQIPGFHCWPGAPEYLAFLRNVHRHVFDISAKIPVTHSDRDMEIIETQASINSYLFTTYGTGDGYHIDIGTMSCEMLAKEIADHFQASEVTVLEDSQGGAAYRRSTG